MSQCYHTYHLQLSDDPGARIACYVHHSPSVGPYPVLALGTAVVMPTRRQLEEIHRQVGDYLALDRAAPAESADCICSGDVCNGCDIQPARP